MDMFFLSTTTLCQSAEATGYARQRDALVVVFWQTHVAYSDREVAPRTLLILSPFITYCSEQLVR